MGKPNLGLPLEHKERLDVTSVNELYSYLVKQLVLYTVVGAAIRIFLYDFPVIETAWLLVGLSFSVGSGGTVLQLARLTNKKHYALGGIFLIIFGLLPF
jgi:hypothetical protein